MELKEKIEKAQNLAEMNELRVEVVQARSNEILLMWQKKYWAMRRCPTCGKES